ncbi:hypothetical protein WJX72_011637 [[Myrmecia] bisecta]|uniref:Flavin-containing monooxygenase n=1 Tax=[Myrmecia] bisecta TaxID=41462 RepID=A0AAW1RA44_9CHLO
MQRPGVPALHKPRLLVAWARVRRVMAPSAALQSASLAPQGPGQKSVAVIGGGAAGLVAARELLRESHCVTVFEQGPGLGGVWKYDPQTEQDDPLGLRPDRQRVHSSMYARLRTNLPREVMAFLDFPFDALTMQGRSSDPRRFCGHEEVQRYLEAFAEAFALEQHMRFNMRVQQLTPLPHSQLDSANGLDSTEQGCPRGQAAIWNGASNETSSNGASTGREYSQEFDAVVVCNGHYSQPRLPDVAGAAAFPGRQLHSHNYRENSAFAGQAVVVVGASASGEDICREVAEVADKVYLCARSWQNPAWTHETTPIGQRANIWRRPMVQALGANGSVTFTDGQTLERVDCILYCTGYQYAFPFLEDAGVVSIEDNRVSPLFQHIFPPTAPSLAFVGLPWRVVPFPQMELQSKWVARVLSGRVSLPAAVDMQRWVDDRYRELDAKQVPVRYTHYQGDAQWAYNDWLAEACGPDVPKLPSWREAMYKATGNNKRDFPEKYRDVWRDEGLVEQAAVDARKSRSRPQHAVVEGVAAA